MRLTFFLAEVAKVALFPLIYEVNSFPTWSSCLRRILCLTCYLFLFIIFLSAILSPLTGDSILKLLK